MQRTHFTVHCVYVTNKVPLPFYIETNRIELYAKPKYHKFKVRIEPWMVYCTDQCYTEKCGIPTPDANLPDDKKTTGPREKKLQHITLPQNLTFTFLFVHRKRSKMRSVYQ